MFILTDSPFPNNPDEIDAELLWGAAFQRMLEADEAEALAGWPVGAFEQDAADAAPESPSPVVGGRAADGGLPVLHAVLGHAGAAGGGREVAMNVTMKLTMKQARPVVAQAFPMYRGRKITLEFASHVTFRDTNWSGGSKSEYVALRADGQIARMPNYAPWNEKSWEGRWVELPGDVLVVERSWFCGQECGIRIYAHPSHAPKWLEGKR